MTGLASSLFAPLGVPAAPHKTPSAKPTSHRHVPCLLLTALLIPVLLPLLFPLFFSPFFDRRSHTASISARLGSPQVALHLPSPFAATPLCVVACPRDCSQNERHRKAQYAKKRVA